MNTPQQHNEWIDCPKGQIAGVSRYFRSRARHLTVRRVSLAVSTFCVLLFAGYLVIGQSLSGKLHAGIYCEEVLKNAESYLSGEIDEDLAKKIKNHLALCEICKLKIDQMKNRKPDERSQVFPNDQTEILSTTR